jgi:hypothetical protein
VAAPSYSVLESTRLTAIVQALQDARQIPQELVFLNRTPVVDAVDGEILGRFIGYIVISDLVADDQAAAVYSSGKMQFESTNIPNIKHGMSVPQSLINLLQSVAANNPITGDAGMLSDRVNQLVDDILTGIRERMEQLIVAMWLDSFTYSRFGIQLSGATWGMPSDLKVTTSIAWDSAGTADGIGDILAQLRYASVRYGKVYNRITMSTAAFNYLVAQTAFQNRAKAAFFPAAVGAVMPIQAMGQMRPIVEALTGCQIELYDARYYQQATDGTFASAPFMPITKVLLSNTADDNRRQVTDFANGVVTESLVGNLANTNVVGGIPGPMRGPISYATVPADLNPPNLTAWGVSRGFPRKKQLQAHSVLTVGAFSDPIPTTAPF